MSLILPDAIAFAMPLAILISSILVFSRLSGDNEITAMRASGVSIWQIIAPGLVLSLFVTAFCFYIYLFVAPISKYKLKTEVKSIGLKNPSAFIEAGEYIEMLPGEFLYVSERNGNNLKDVSIKSLDEDGKVVRFIVAKTGKIVVDNETNELLIPLQDVVVMNYKYSDKDPVPDIKRPVSQEKTFSRSLMYELDRKPLKKKDKYLNLPESIARIQLMGEVNVKDIKDKRKRRKFVEAKSKMLFELNKRMAMALSPIAFLLVGMSFGFRSQRSETSFGLMASLAVAVAYYVMMMVAEIFSEKPSMHPEILVWIPNIILQVGGIFVLWKVTKR